MWNIIAGAYVWFCTRVLGLDATISEVLARRWGIPVDLLHQYLLAALSFITLVLLVALIVVSVKFRKELGNARKDQQNTRR